MSATTCEVPDCGCGGAPAKARFMCPSAYATWISRGRPDMPGRVGQRMDPSSTRAYAPPLICSAIDKGTRCTTKARGRGMCSKHLKRDQRNGSPTTRQLHCQHNGHPWTMNGPGRPSRYCPEHRPSKEMP